MTEGIIACPTPLPTSRRTSASSDDVTAPDGSDAFGFEPYVAVMGGYASFDDNTLGSGIPNRINGNNRQGAAVEGIVGANIPLSAFFIGAEGNVAKGVDGQIDWQYGVAGRVGLRAGETGLGGLTGESGARIRVELTTRDFESIRPMAGLVFHF
ncbi:MAG: opacity protein [Sphingopyxis sp.]|nr:opacity protein [Sphingopyxis sp.]